MDNKMVRIVFMPSGIRGEVESGTDVLAAARLLGADLASLCGGNGLCTRCKVQCMTGSFSKHQINSTPDHLSPTTTSEKERLSKADLDKGFRLGCSAQIMSDVVVDIPPESQTHLQVVRKDVVAQAMEVFPAVRLLSVDVEEPGLNVPSGDLERLCDAIEFETGLKNLHMAIPVLQKLQNVLKRGKWQVSVAIDERSQIIGVWPGEVVSIYGLAVDIGSTTIAGHLCNLSNGEVLASQGMMNPQIRFGEDVMSRVSYAMMNPGGDVEMTTAVRTAINQLIDNLLKEVNLDRGLLLDAVLVGNPIMHHLFLGIDPIELGGAPFALATQSSVIQAARDLDLKLAPGANIYMPPCIAGHVGADAAAVVLSESPYQQDETTLIIDVGTNAEIILGNKTQLVAASAPTGPAFEGAQIHHGQRAAPGAIERVRIDPVTLEPRYKVIGIEPWSDEKGFNAAIKKTGVTGICGSGIIEAIATLYLAGVIRSDGIINGNGSQRSSRVETDGKTWAYRLVHKSKQMPGVLITQNDVRAIQLAKSTLYASVQLLMDKIHVSKIERIRFAGAFGSHIDPLYAMVLGMIPDCPLDQVMSVGNAAGTGARIALVSQNARREIETEVRKMKKIETATEPNFQDYFVNAMAIPHKTDSFENLSQIISLPKASDTAPGPGQRTRRRRRTSRRGKTN